MAWVYLLQCADDTLYCGWTLDLERRLKTHNQGRGSKYTRVRLPVKMVYREKCRNRGAAMRRECEIKKLSRHLKLKLCQGLDERQGGF